MMKSGRIKKYLKIGVELKLFEKKTGVLKIIWELEFWKLNLIIGVLEIKFERNWSFENYLKIGVLKIRFKNWNFGKLFENESLEN